MIQDKIALFRRDAAGIKKRSRTDTSSLFTITYYLKS